MNYDDFSAKSSAGSANAGRRSSRVNRLADLPADGPATPRRNASY